MTTLNMLLALSLGLSGIGGFLSGLCAHSLTRVCMWAMLFGMSEAMLLLVLSPEARFNPIFLGIALFWALVGWFVFGRIDPREASDTPASRFQNDF